MNGVQITTSQFGLSATNADLDDEKAEFDKVLEDHSKANTDTENSIEQGSHDISKSN